MLIFKDKSMEETQEDNELKANIERQRLENEEKQKKGNRYANIHNSVMERPSAAIRLSHARKAQEEVEESFDSEK